MAERKPIKNFMDLEVWQMSFQASIDVIQHILPALPKEEQDDLQDQLRRSCKAVPRLIGEGYGKKHQKKGFQKYLDDAMSESNETLVGLMQAGRLYLTGDEKARCEMLVLTYTSVGKMLYALRKSWDKFSDSDSSRS